MNGKSGELTAKNDQGYLSSTSTKPKLIPQINLSDLIRDLSLPKNKAEDQDKKYSSQTTYPVIFAHLYMAGDKISITHSPRSS